MYSKIGIILINYKDYCERFLADARDSLRKTNYPKDKMQVYIIDNASTSCSLNKIKNLYPEARVISTSGNGWGHANNIGMKSAFSDECDAVVLLNMDMLFDADWLINLIIAAQKDNESGIFQPLILLEPSKEDGFHINSRGNIFHYLGFGFCDGYNELFIENEKERNIQYASGAAMFIKKEVIDLIGECDEEYFMYHDDLELCLKARFAGYKIALAPKSIVYHKYEFSRSIKQVFYMERNRYLTMFIFYKWKTLFVLLPAIIIMDFGMWLYSIAGGWFFSKCRVFVYFLMVSTWKHVFRERKKIEKLRKILDKELLENSASTVDFQEIQNFLLKKIGNPFLRAYFKFVKKIIIW